MIGTYGSAIAISVAAILLGRGVCALTGDRDPGWLAPSVGFAALMVVCQVFIRLPGRGWTAAAAVGALCLASVALSVTRRIPWPSVRAGLPVAIVVLGAVSVPFIANGRVGLLGVSISNDTSVHLILAEALLKPAIQPLNHYGPGYPLGPHAVAATFAQGLGSSVDKTLTGVLMSTPILTGLSALGALGDMPRTRRWLVAVLTAVPYMASAWYIQSAFKEPIVALLMVGLVLVLRRASSERFEHPARIIVPLAVLVVGVLYDYSYPGLIWPGAVLVCWTGIELTVGGGWRHWRALGAWLRYAMPAVAVGLLVLIVLVGPDFGRIHTFWVNSGGTGAGTTGGITATGANSLGNLAGPLRSLEGLNIWLSGVFQYAPTDLLHAGLLSGLALIVLVLALVSALEERDLAWVAGLLGVALVYAYAKHDQGPYVAAKALMIPAPLLALGSGRALMRRFEPGALAWRGWAGLGFAALAIAFFFFSFKSDYLVLRDAQVDPVDHTNELRSLRPLLHDQPTLFLVNDDYMQWELVGVEPVLSPAPISLPTVPVRPSEPYSPGQAYEFDSFSASTLNRFDYVITTRTNAQSEPPPNFRVVGKSASYEVWHRIGLTQPFFPLPAESGRPGVVLDCKSRAGRRITHERGSAQVRTPPQYYPISPLLPGGSENATVQLPAGGWDLSLPFISQQAISVRGGGLDVRLPPNLDRPGNTWPIGQIQSSGAPVTLTFTMADPSPIAEGAGQAFAPQSLIAARAAPDSTVPLRSACGRYVDWYQLT